MSNKYPNLIMHFKFLEKEKKANPQISSRKEILKIRTEINEMKTKRTIQRISETKSCFFKGINTIDKP
jgi:hypothetical protein